MYANIYLDLYLSLSPNLPRSAIVRLPHPWSSNTVQSIIYKTKQKEFANLLRNSDNSHWVIIKQITSNNHEQRRNEDFHKHIRWRVCNNSWRLKAISYHCKALHLSLDGVDSCYVSDVT